MFLRNWLFSDRDCTKVLLKILVYSYSSVFSGVLYYISELQVGQNGQNHKTTPFIFILNRFKFVELFKASFQLSKETM